MNSWDEREQLQCEGCGHRWILVSDKKITYELHSTWLMKVYLEHVKINQEE